MNLFSGKVTFFTAGASFFYGLIGLIFGFGDDQTNIAFILGGLGAFGLRRAIK